MSYLLNQEVPCSHCQFPNEVEVWSVVNVKDDPELKDLILGGELNMAECTACKKIFYAEDFLLYHDPESELMAFVYPYKSREERSLYEAKTAENFAAFQESAEPGKRVPYPPVTFFGLDELVHVLEEEDKMVIQSEIMTVLAGDLALDLVRFKPADARRRKLPWVLPRAKKTSSVRQGVIEGLETVAKINDRLDVYGRVLKSLKENAELEIVLG